jgi:nitrogen PTS system EIIA component
MMEMTELITPQSVVAGLRVATKRQLLQELAKRAAPLARLDEKVIFETLVERERLGSTGIGGGTAVPHGRLPKLERMFAFFARLEKPIPFESVDDQPVDLVFLLLTPDTAGADHLKALARVSRLLRDSATCTKLRGTDRADALYALLTDRAASNAA